MAEYSFVTTWRVAAPIGKVWDALQCISTWWPGMAAPRHLNPGQDGVGARYERVTRGKLPYDLRYVITVTRFDPPHACAYDSEGDLVGQGSYVLATAGETTEVVFTWDVATRGFWMNVLAPLLKPLFAWNHNWVMTEGEKGLARYLREQAGGRELTVPRWSPLREIQTLDPVRDHQRIVFLSTRWDFPFDTVRSLELALFRTFCVPSIAALLDRTGEFRDRAQKRYDDTDIIVSELMDHGYDSERGKAALRRMNQMHGRFAISNDDFLYVLSTFVFEPIRWNERFGWRRMCPAERLAMFHFWRQVGRRMNIRDIPEDYDAFERFSRDYEARHFHYTEANHRVGCATRDLFASWFPRVLRPLVRPVIYAMMDDAMLTGFGFPRPSRLMCWLVPAALRLRARALRLLPGRRRPLLRTELKHPTYPSGYTIEQLGPPAGTCG